MAAPCLHRGRCVGPLVRNAGRPSLRFAAARADFAWYGVRARNGDARATEGAHGGRSADRTPPPDWRLEALDGDGRMAGSPVHADPESDLPFPRSCTAHD